jgi:hypothetical protein
MYAGVPPANGPPSESGASTCDARPKSVSLTVSAPSALRTTSTFPGLRSRWITPRACAWPSASSSDHTTVSNSVQVNLPPSGASVPPRTSSIASHGVPSRIRSWVTRAVAASASPASYTRTTFGWSSAATRRTSLRNAWRNPGFLTARDVRNLTATG